MAIPKQPYGAQQQIGKTHQIENPRIKAVSCGAPALEIGLSNRLTHGALTQRIHLNGQKQNNQEKRD